MANQIARLREERGWSQDRLAELLGFDGAGRRMIIQRWELGQREPSVANAKKLMEVFACAFEELGL